MICEKCGNKINVGIICGKCGHMNRNGGRTAESNISAEKTDESVSSTSSIGMSSSVSSTSSMGMSSSVSSTSSMSMSSSASSLSSVSMPEMSEKPKMRVTAYGAVVPNDGSIYISSGLRGVAGSDADGGAVLEHEDDNSEHVSAKQSSLAEMDWEEPKTTENVNSAYTQAVEVHNEAAENAAATVASVDEPAVKIEKIDTDMSEIVKKTAKKMSQQFEVHDGFNLNLEEPVQYQPAQTKTKKAKGPKKKRSTLADKIVGLCVVLILALLLTPLAIKMVQKYGYDKQIKAIAELFDTKNTDSKAVMDAVLPAFMADSYNEIMEICESNIEYAQEMSVNSVESVESMNQAYSAVYGAWEKDYGTVESVKCSVKSKETLSKEEKDAIERAYESMSVLTTGIQSIYESQEELSSLTEQEIEDISTIIGNLGETMKDMDVSSGYIVDATLKVKGSTRSGSDTIEVVVVKVDGKWMIEYVSTIMLNMKNYDTYTLETVDQFVEYELNINRLNEELKRMGQHISDDGITGLYNYILNGV